MSTPALSRPALARLVLVPFGLGMLILGVLCFLPAGTWAYWEAWVYLGLLTSLVLAFATYLLFYAPDLLERRMHTTETEPAQNRLIRLFLLPLLLLYILPGFDHRWGWSDVPAAVALAADGVVLLGYALFVWVLRTNHYASRVVEVMPGQTVITTGPYAIVRHPLYVAVLLMYLATPVALGSYWALVPALVLPVALMARIRNEEDVLRRDLPGYAAYIQKIRYRLIPGVW